MEIPYTVDERPDTGVYNAKLGVWLFLASEVMLFGGLFSAYVFLRLGAPVGAFHEWGLELNVPLATLNTMILISSSMTMVMSCLLYTSPSPRDLSTSRMPSSA